MSKIIQLSDRTHVLKRPARYIGSIVPVEVERPVLKNDKIIFDTIKYTPALIKIIREILDNSVDAIIKTGKGNLIKINIDEEKIIIEDNSTGIPVSYINDEHGNTIEKYAPEAVWTELKTGSNFDDLTTSVHAGQNGEGSTLTNIFSTKFIGETDDGTQYFKLECQDNMDPEKIKTTISKSKGKSGTKVTFWPDLEKLHIDKIDSLYQNLIKFEVLYLAATYPKIDFKLNNSLIKIKSFRQLYNQYFDDHIVSTETNDIFIAFSHSIDGYKFIHFINGINVFNGGKVLEYADQKIIGNFTERLQKRYPNIKRNDVKNKIIFHCLIKNLSLPRFADQIKSESVNIIGSNDNIGSQILEISNSKFIDKLYKDKEIVGPIIDLFKAKEMIKDKKELVRSVKKIKKPVKYWPATKSKKYLIISEGDSAIGSIINGIGRDNYGFYPIKGKTSNVLKDSKKLQSDKELLEMASSNILGIDFSGKQEKLNYENIVIAADYDQDGSHITSLLLGFFYLTVPEYLKKQKIYRFVTPIAISYNKNKIDQMFFTFEDVYSYKGSNIAYKKGLGSLEEEEWEELFRRYSFDDLLLPITIESDDDIKILESWLMEDREYRKKIIKENINKFNLDTV